MKCYIPLSSGIIEHYPRMRDALWLFTYLVDKQTKGVKDGRGEVLGGRPIRDSDIATASGASGKTISRWRGRLISEGYITARRTPYGYVYYINKPKKWEKEIGQKCPVSSERDRTKLGNLGEGEISPTCPPDFPNVSTRFPQRVRNKEEKQEKQVVVPATATLFLSEAEEKQFLSVWKYFLQAFDKEQRLTSAYKKQGLAILRRHAELGHDPVQRMTSAIDLAAKKVKEGKAFFSQWHAIFGKEQTYRSLLEEYQDTECVPEAATIEV